MKCGLCKQIEHRDDLDHCADCDKAICRTCYVGSEGRCRSCSSQQNANHKTHRWFIEPLSSGPINGFHVNSHPCADCGLIEFRYATGAGKNAIAFYRMPNGSHCTYVPYPCERIKRVPDRPSCRKCNRPPAEIVEWDSWDVCKSCAPTPPSLVLRLAKGRDAIQFDAGTIHLATFGCDTMACGVEIEDDADVIQSIDAADVALVCVTCVQSLLKEDQ